MMGATGFDPEERRRLRRDEKIRSMSTSEGELCVLRASVRCRSALTSQAKVARQLGVSAATLHHFVRGRLPGPKTVERLERWYRAAVLAGELELAPGGAVLVLKPILRAVPRAERSAAAAELVTAVHQYHLRTGLTVPKWVKAALQR